MKMPTNAAIPAVDSRRYVLAHMVGRRIVDMVWEDLTPAKVQTGAAFQNAIAVAMLFITGYAFGRRIGARPWLAGLTMVVLGTVLYPPTTAFGEYGVQFVGLDAYTPAEVGRWFELVKATIYCSNSTEAFYMPTFEQSEAAPRRSSGSSSYTSTEEKL